MADDKPEVAMDLGGVADSKYRVRVLRSKARGFVLDVREYVKGSNYESFTRKGVRLTCSEARVLVDMLIHGVTSVESTLRKEGR